MQGVKYYDHDDTLTSSYYSDHDGDNCDDDDDYQDDECDSDDDYHDDECDSDCEFDLKKRNPIFLATLGDDDAEFLVKMKSLFDVDDLDGDLELMEPEEQYTMEPALCPSFVVRLITLYGAEKCATALLQHQTCFFVDLNIPFKDGTYPLFLAAQWLNYNLVELFLSHGARADVTNESTMKSNSLPLKAALETLNMHLYLYDWTPEESIYKLVIILCLPQMKVALETIRLLAMGTKHVNELFIDYAMEGKLIQMTVLLLVANELIMGPTTFQNNDAATRHSLVFQGMTIHDTIMEDILSQADEESELSVCNSKKRSKADQVCKGRRAAFTLILLKIFERTGNAIQSYLRSRQSRVVPKERVVKDVTSILNEAGFLLKEKDMDLSNIDCESDTIKEVTGTSESITGYNSRSYYYMILQSLYEFRAKSPKRRTGWVLVKDVASILKEAGFVLKGKDIDLMSNVDCKGDEIKEAARRSAYKSEKYSDILPALFDDRFIDGKLNPVGWPRKHKVYSGKLVKSFSSSSDMPPSHCFRPLHGFAVFQLQKNQFKGEKNTLQRPMLPSQSSRLLASHALSFEWGMRCV